MRSSSFSWSRNFVAIYESRRLITMRRAGSHCCLFRATEARRKCVYALFVRVATLRGTFAEQFREAAINLFVSVGPCVRRRTLRLQTEEFL
jgi:hypothetical protein